MNWIRLLIYKISRNEILGKIPGFWRFGRWAKTLVSDRYYRFPYLNGQVYVCPVQAMGKNIYQGELYEPEVIQLIQHFVRKGYSFVDIGANIGLHSLAAAFNKVSEQQQFVAFEPEPGCFSVLQKNCRANQLEFVECRQEALGQTDDVLTLNISTTLNKGNHTLLERKGTKPGVQVKVRTLDTIFSKDSVKVKSPLLLKMDVEGYEWPVIIGGVEWMSKIEELNMICEITPAALETFGKTIDDLYQKMRQIGFSEYYTINQSYHYDPETPAFSNMLFTKGPNSLALAQALPKDFVNRKKIFNNTSKA